MIDSQDRCIHTVKRVLGISSLQSTFTRPSCPPLIWNKPLPSRRYIPRVHSTSACNSACPKSPLRLLFTGLCSIGLYRENAIAIENEARDPFGGNVYYVTMQITFPIPEFARTERNLHCDVVHVTTKWVSRLVLDHAIAAIQTSR